MEQVKQVRVIDFYWLARMTAWIYILSVIDGVLTIFWVLSKRATEANPLMNHLISQNPVLFMVVKIALVALGITLLWRFRERPLATWGIVACFLIYSTIFVHHLAALTRFFII